MQYYLNTYLEGMDQFMAYEYFGMDPVIYISPGYIFNDKDLANWKVDYRETGIDADGNHYWERRVTTPDGILTEKGAYNQFTPWITEYIIKDENSFEIWNKYVPVPVAADWSEVIAAKERIGDRGIVRGGLYDFGQGSPWQSFVNIYGTEKSIMDCFDKPDWVHYVLRSMLDKKLTAIERGGKIHLDLVETGGGAGSSTVVSPGLHEKFCMPYDQIQHKAIHEKGAKIVYHLCGGMMPLLEIVAQNGTDGLETMTPTDMGGDCSFAEAVRRVGDKLFHNLNY